MKSCKNKKENKRKIVQAYPQVSMLAEIMIIDENKPVAVGGFSIDGGFYLREGFDLIKRKTKDIQGEDITYFNFVKIPKKKGVIEKIFLKQKKEEISWKKKRKKELQGELKKLTGNKLLK